MVSAHLILCLSAFSPVLTTALQQATCNSYVLISTRGTNEAQGHSKAFPSLISQVLAKIPGGLEYDTVYPAVDGSAQMGTDAIVSYINNGTKNCPSQRYVLLGYSQGAIASAGALAVFNDTTSAAYKAIRAVVTVGNPAHKAGQAADVDEAGGTTTKPFFGFLYLLVDRIPDLWYTSGKVLDICYQNDLVCVGATPGSILNGGQAHQLYGTTASVQNIGAAFAEKALQS